MSTLGRAFPGWDDIEDAPVVPNIGGSWMTAGEDRRRNYELMPDFYPDPEPPQGDPC